MTSIQSYIFIDLLTERNEVTKVKRITQVSVVAEDRSQYLESDDTVVAPDELTFRFYRNDKEPEFDKKAFNDFISFINRQETPVCLLFHNRGDFDFPLLQLQEQFQEFNVSLPNNVTCADGLTGFRYILENKNWKPNINPGTLNLKSSSKQDTENVVRENVASFSLRDIYERVTEECEPPQTYTMMMFRISQVFDRFFITWVDQNQRPVKEVNDNDVNVIKKKKKPSKDRSGLGPGVLQILASAPSIPEITGLGYLPPRPHPQ